MKQGKYPPRVSGNMHGGVHGSKALFTRRGVARKELQNPVESPL
jgi:hypothetical protein